MTEIGSNLINKFHGGNTSHNKIYLKDKINMQKYGKNPWKRKQCIQKPHKAVCFQ